MPVKKLSVALNKDIAEQAAALAERDGVSLSAWLNAAAVRAIRIELGRRGVAQWEAENGAFTEEELAWADSVLDRLGDA